MLSFILMVIGHSFDNVSDETLIEQYRDGDVDALETLLKRYERKLFNYILRYVGQRERANDLLQDTFLRVVKHAERYDRRAKFKTWLYTIARNICIDELRKDRVRSGGVSFEQSNSRGGDGLAAKDRIAGSHDDGYKAASASELQERLISALERLNDKQREVFVLRHIDQMRFREIADLLGTSENTIKSRMRYAFENLRDLLADYASEQ
ncbi:MAG: RNA polymerase subunit sigma [Myxococcales bacterium]|nr:RNA polymerase subunit sigma [Myxococcales bacterium]|tara:strand:- start:401 stop:1027 length:627 start_codon:yes stop_codon:yes gene_type:complete